jgi:hypothetical protein
MQKIGGIGLLIFLTFMFLFQETSVGQDKKKFVINGKIIPEVETSENGTVEVSKSGVAEPMIVEISKNRHFKLDLDFFSEYSLIFKLAGHFNKTIIVSTDLPDEVWKRDNNFPPFPMVVQLFREIDGIDKSFTLKPAGKIFYSKQTDNFDKENYALDKQIANQMDAAKAQSEQVKKEEIGRAHV